MNPTIVGAVLHAISVFGLVLAAIFASPERLQTIVPILAAIAGVGGTMTARGPAIPKSRNQQGFTRLSVLFVLAIVAWLFTGCVHTFQCKEGGVVKLKANPDGSAALVAPCDGDDEAVRIEWKKFNGLNVKGLRPVPHPKAEVL